MFGRDVEQIVRDLVEIASASSRGASALVKAKAEMARRSA